MTLQPEELFGSPVSQPQSLRAWPEQDGIRPGRLAALAADAELPNLTPLSYRDADGMYAVWSGQESAVYTITSNATPATAGTFTLTFNGETTAAIAFDANAAAVKAAIVALGSVGALDVTTADSGGGTDLGDASHVVTITFGGALAGVDVDGSADMSGLTGNAHVLAEVTQGGGSDLGEVDGLLWAPDEPVQGLLAGEVLIQVFRAGLVHAADVPLPAGESQPALDAALKSMELRKKGIMVQGLVGVA